MPNSVDLQDQGRKSPGFPEEKPVTGKLTIVQIIVLSILLGITFVGCVYLAYVQFWLIPALKH